MSTLGIGKNWPEMDPSFGGLFIPEKPCRTACQSWLKLTKADLKAYDDAEDVNAWREWPLKSNQATPY